MAASTRSFTLPNTVNPEEVKASYAKGVLTITLGKRAEARPKQIKVEVKPEIAEKSRNDKISGGYAAIDALALARIAPHSPEDGRCGPPGCDTGRMPAGSNWGALVDACSPPAPLSNYQD